MIEIVKGVFGMPDSPCGWWKELLDTLQGDVAPVEEAGETASSTSDQSRALTTENEDARQFWHDEGRPHSFCIGHQGQQRVEEEASEHVHFRQDRREAWDLRLVRRCLGPATAYLLTGSIDTANERFEAEVPSPAVGNMFGVSGGTSGSIVGTMRANPSPTTAR